MYTYIYIYIHNYIVIMKHEPSPKWHIESQMFFLVTSSSELRSRRLHAMMTGLLGDGNLRMAHTKHRDGDFGDGLLITVLAFRLFHIHRLFFGGAMFWWDAWLIWDRATWQIWASSYPQCWSDSALEQHPIVESKVSQKLCKVERNWLPFTQSWLQQLRWSSPRNRWSLLALQHRAPCIFPATSGIRLHDGCRMSYVFRAVRPQFHDLSAWMEGNSWV